MCLFEMKVNLPEELIQNFVKKCLFWNAEQLCLLIGPELQRKRGHAFSGQIFKPLYLVLF